MDKSPVRLLLLSLAFTPLFAQVALVRHSPTLNGTVEGSVQVMTAESVTLNGGASVTGDLLIPGTPAVQLNGNPTYGGTLDGTGAATPTSHKVTLNGNAKLGHVVRRTDAIALPTVAASPPPAGTRNVKLRLPGEPVGDFSTLLNLTLKKDVGQIAVPPGSYGRFTAQSGEDDNEAEDDDEDIGPSCNSGFTLGVAGATEPAIYHFQRLTLKRRSHLQVVGPVIVTLKDKLSANGSVGSAAHPEWLILQLSEYGLTLKGGATAWLQLVAPSGQLKLNGQAMLTGAITVDRLNLKGGTTLRLLAPPLPFLANFEPAEGYQPGPLHGQNGWSVTGSATVGTALKYAGTQGVTVAPAASAALLVRAFVNDDPSIAFVDLFALPAAAPTAEAGVFLDTDAARVALTGAGGTPGRLQAFQGDGAGAGIWFPTEQGPALDATGRAVDWLRLTVRSDYAAKKWDLYFNGQMIAADLGFINNTATAFTGLGLSGHTTQTTGFDDLLVAFDHPLFIDADHDGMDDAWETAHGLNPALNDRNGDLDADGLTNIQEYVLGTKPNNVDTDGDGMPDGWEVRHGLNPLTNDSALDPDGDGLTHAQEFFAGTNPHVADTDIDGISDAKELSLGTNPVNADSDGDGLPDGWERAHRLDPLSAADAALDADGDGASNLAEYRQGSDAGDFYNAVAPTFAAQVGADGQLGPDGVVAVRLTKPDGTPWVNAPVYFISGGDVIEGFADAPMRQIAEIHALIEGSTVIRTDTHGEARIVIDSLLTIPWSLTIYPVGTNAGAPLSLTVWPRGRDGNGNQLADAWEQLYFPESPPAAGDDPDSDGLSHAQEERAGTNPIQADSDGDSLMDGWELARGFNPLVGEPPVVLDADADADGLSLREEAAAGTDPTSADSDGDGVPDGYEVRAGINPLADDRGLDPDGDGLTNEQERARGTDPTDYYNGVPHVILPFIGGDGQLGASNLLAVRVVAADGTPLINAPVVFTVDEGEQIKLTPGGPPVGRTAEVRTGPGGIARIYLHVNAPAPE